MITKNVRILLYFIINSIFILVLNKDENKKYSVPYKNILYMSFRNFSHFRKQKEYFKIGCERTKRGFENIALSTQGVLTNINQHF